jgi:hypothetical protein
MALQTVTLEEAAGAFGVHPRTILRAIKQDHNTYWTEDSDQDVLQIKDIAKAYGVKPFVLVAVFEGRDALLRADEAADVIGMAARTFRKHLMRKGTAQKWGRVSYGGITRYLETKINTAAIDAME